VFSYTYDLGDNWLHRITVERVEPAEPVTLYPAFLGGARRSPAGGLWQRSWILCLPRRRHRQGKPKEEAGAARQAEKSSRDLITTCGPRRMGTKVTGRKRHILDTLRLLLNVAVHSADVQDDGAPLVIDRRTRHRFPFIERIFADAGYQGPKTAAALAKTGTWRLEIVKRNELHRFVVLPKRWIVERTLAWISRNRRLARDFERYARTAAAFVRLAMIRIMLRRLTRLPHCS
jgi:putative transposase